MKRAVKMVSDTAVVRGLLRKANAVSNAILQLRWALFLSVILLGAQTDDVVAEPIHRIEIGPQLQNMAEGLASVDVRALYVGGKLVGYSRENWVRILSDDEVLYLGCDVVTVLGGVDGDRREWRVVNLTTLQEEVFDIPGFDHDWSFPAIRFPHIAYLAVKGDGEISCTVFNWITKRVVANRVMPEATTYATDVPGPLFDSPEFSEDGNEITCLAPSLNVAHAVSTVRMTMRI